MIWPRSPQRTLLVALLCASACSDPSYRLVLSYPDEEAYARAHWVEVFVGEERNCAALEASDTAPSLEFDPYGEVPTPGTVAFGRVAFLARVRDADCQIFLRGCQEVQLEAGEDSTVRIALLSFAGSSCSAGLRCQGGRCLAGDAGAIDAARRDTAVPDAAAPDSAAPDTSGRDAAALDQAVTDTAADDLSAHDTAVADTGTADLEPADAHDAGLPDAAVADAGGTDIPAADSATLDAARVDMSVVDAHPPDAFVRDVSAPDLASPDTSTPDAGPTPPIEIFRSVGPGNTSPLAQGGANLLRISGDQASFTAALPDNVGVGDAIQYDTGTDGSVDALAFVHGRSSSTVYFVATSEGATPAPTAPSGTQTWSLFRAYTSLVDAAGADENPGIAGNLRNFDRWSLGRDLAAYNEIFHFACYADAVDSAEVQLEGWYTSMDNYLHIYTPHLPSEVGRSQRHQGRWTDTAYTLRPANLQYDCIANNTDYLYIEGLQIDVIHYASYNIGVSAFNLGEDAITAISDCIVRGNGSGAQEEYTAIEIWSTASSATLLAFNNVIYGFRGSANYQGGLWASDGYLVALNNTIADCETGIISETNQVIAVNNLIVGCDQATTGRFLEETDYNATDLSTMGYDLASALHDRVDQTFSFVDFAGRDLHLASDDTGARNRGSAEVDAYLDHDIDGEPRPYGAAFDIGADEYHP